MRVISPDSDGDLDAGTLEVLRDAVRIAFWNQSAEQGDRLRSDGGQRGLDPGAETDSGTRKDPIDPTATTSSTSLPWSRSQFRSRLPSDGREWNANDRFRFTGQATGWSIGSESNSQATGMNGRDVSGSFNGFPNSAVEVAKNNRITEREDSDSTSDRNISTSWSHKSLAAMSSHEEESQDTPHGHIDCIPASNYPAAAKWFHQGEGQETPHDTENFAPQSDSSLASTSSDGEEGFGTPDSGDDEELANGNAPAALRFTRGEGLEDLDHHSDGVQLSKLPASQPMLPLLGVIIPVHTKKRTRQEDTDSTSKATIPTGKKKQNERVTNPLVVSACTLHVEEKFSARSRLHDERELCTPTTETARAERFEDEAEAFAYLDALPTMRFTQPNFDPFVDHIICKY